MEKERRPIAVGGRKKSKKAAGDFFKGAAIIAVGGFIAKIIGALYRIPLTNLLGGYGIGLYQMAYPFYCLLLTVSATGIPASVAKMVAENRANGETGKSVLRGALRLFLAVGLTGTALMAAFAPLLSSVQGEARLRNGYFVLAPSVFFVSAIAVFRGWFQGKNDMLPTAVSEVTEQIVKVLFGLLFAYLYRADAEKAVAFILLSVTISEAAALLFMLSVYRRRERGLFSLKNGGRVAAKSVLRLSLPVTATSALLPLSALIDSVIVVRLLGRYEENAVTLYGLFTGGAATIVNLPVSVCYGVAAAVVPAVSAAFSRSAREAEKHFFVALGLTLALSLPSAVGLYFLASPAVRLVFRALGESDAAVLVRLVKLFSVSAVFLSCTQTVSACLTGLGSPKYAALSMAVAVAVKTALNFYLVSRPDVSVYGAAIAADACYAVSFLLDSFFALLILKRKKKRKKRP